MAGGDQPTKVGSQRKSRGMPGLVIRDRSMQFVGQLLFLNSGLSLNGGENVPHPLAHGSKIADKCRRTNRGHIQKTLPVFEKMESAGSECVGEMTHDIAGKFILHKPRITDREGKRFLANQDTVRP